MSVSRSGSGPVKVLIAGGGFAALEAALALRALAGEHVHLGLVAPEAVLRYRPAAPLEMTDEAPPRSYDLKAIAEQLQADLHLGRLEAVAPEPRIVRLSSGARLGYHALVLAIGARAVAAIPGARMFRDQRDRSVLRGVLDEIRAGTLERLVMAVPSGSSWPLPLYELALLIASEARSAGAAPELSIVTPERTPLEIFGPVGSRAVATALEQDGIGFLGGRMPVAVRRDGALEVQADGAVAADRVLAIPQLRAHRISGVPASWWGFVPTDISGRVEGLRSVYAAGDMTAFSVKQGGLATQQADRIAYTIAEALGLPVKAPDPRHVLQARLATGRGDLLLRTELDWLGRPVGPAHQHGAPSAPAAAATKVFGRYLAPYLEAIDRVAA